MGPKVLLFGLTVTSFESKLTVKQIEFRLYRLSAKCGYELGTGGEGTGPDVLLQGNISPLLLLNGLEEEIEAAVKDLLALGV